ncbi:MAG: VIT1/CCC1 transporter family protein [Halanaerobiales bacterium]|nr:VIT1/CCC1 transporter family protein [Halanaerobiales bacterium]
MEKDIFEKIIKMQKDEITEHHIYTKLAKRTKDKENKEIILSIAKDELRHYNFWNMITKSNIKANKIKIYFYYFISVIFGLTFGIKLMEKREEEAQDKYEELIEQFEGAKEIIDDEEEHEKELLDMLEEERLNYVGSIVLGLNDALVELTGSLAGWSFALKDTGLIAVTGLIMGVAASLSMAASEYLAKKADTNHKYALKSSLYTGSAYVITVVLLILPYLLLESYMLSLIVTVVVAITIILVFNFYISVAKNLNFKKRFFEMAGISIGVAVISFLIGIAVRTVLGVDI